MICKVGKRKNNYGVVTADVMLNTALSSDARFLLAMVSVLPPDWQFFVRWLRQKTGWGKDKLQRVMGELEQMGHLCRTRQSQQNGRFVWEYTFHLEPEPEKPATEKPAPENTANKPNSSKPVVPPSDSSKSSKKESGGTTTTKTAGGGAPLSASLKEERTESNLVRALREFLAQYCGDDGQYKPDAPMIVRTARCLGTRYEAVDDFQAECQSLINWIAQHRPTLTEVREAFGIE